MEASSICPVLGKQDIYDQIDSSLRDAFDRAPIDCPNIIARMTRAIPPALAILRESPPKTLWDPQPSSRLRILFRKWVGPFATMLIFLTIHYMFSVKYLNWFTLPLKILCETILALALERTDQFNRMAWIRIVCQIQN